jgi:disulfide bond formation protein DsbB
LTANYALKINEKIIIFILFLTFVFSFSISVYHFGIEQGFFKESAVCEQKNAMDIISKEELLKQLSEKNVSCKDVTFRIFGLSLTSINIILSLIITILLINIYKKYEKIKS